MNPAHSKRILKFGPLTINTQKRSASIGWKPLVLTQNERGALALLARYQGEVCPSRYLMARMRGGASLSVVSRVITSLRKKFVEGMGPFGRNIIEGGAEGPWRILSDAEYKNAIDDGYGERVPVDIGWFKFVIEGDGTAKLSGGRQILDDIEVQILRYVFERPEIYHLPGTIARQAFNGKISGISVGKKLRSLVKKIKNNHPDHAKCLDFKVYNKLHYVMFVPHGTNVEAIQKKSLEQNIERQVLDWFSLEISAQFNRKRAAAAARVADTNVILDPRDTAALLFAYKHDGQWLTGRTIKQDDLGPNVQTKHFFKHMKRAYDKLEAGGLEPGRYIQFKAKSYVRFLRKGFAYDVSGDKPLAVPLVMKGDVAESLNAGDWFTLDIRQGGTSVIAQTNRVFNISATAIFKYAVQNPETILRPKIAPEIFPQGLSGSSFRATVVHIMRALAQDGYGQAMYSEQGKGAIFVPRKVLHMHGDDLRGYFNQLQDVNVRERLPQAVRGVDTRQVYGPFLPV